MCVLQVPTVSYTPGVEERTCGRKGLKEIYNRMIGVCVVGRREIQLNKKNGIRRKLGRKEKKKKK